MTFVMTIYSCPTSLQVLIISSYRRHQEANISKLYMFVYPIAMVTLAILVTGYIVILYE